MSMLSIFPSRLAARHRLGYRLGRCFCFAEVSTGHPHPRQRRAIFRCVVSAVSYDCTEIVLVGEGLCALPLVWSRFFAGGETPPLRTANKRSALNRVCRKRIYPFRQSVLDRVGLFYGMSASAIPYKLY